MNAHVPVSGTASPAEVLERLHRANNLPFRSEVDRERARYLVASAPEDGSLPVFAGWRYQEDPAETRLAGFQLGWLERTAIGLRVVFPSRSDPSLERIGTVIAETPGRVTVRYQFKGRQGRPGRIATKTLPKRLVRMWGNPGAVSPPTAAGTRG